MEEPNNFRDTKLRVTSCCILLFFFLSPCQGRSQIDMIEEMSSVLDKIIIDVSSLQNYIETSPSETFSTTTDAASTGSPENNTSSSQSTNTTDSSTKYTETSDTSTETSSTSQPSTVETTENQTSDSTTNATNIFEWPQVYNFMDADGITNDRKTENDYGAKPMEIIDKMEWKKTDSNAAEYPRAEIAHLTAENVQEILIPSKDNKDAMIVIAKQVGFRSGAMKEFWILNNLELKTAMPVFLAASESPSSFAMPPTAVLEPSSKARILTETVSTEKRSVPDSWTAVKPLSESAKISLFLTKRIEENNDTDDLYILWETLEAVHILVNKVADDGKVSEEQLSSMHLYAGTVGDIVNSPSDNLVQFLNESPTVLAVEISNLKTSDMVLETLLGKLRTRKVAIIVASTACGLVVLIIIGLSVCLLRRKKKAEQVAFNESNASQASNPNDEIVEETDSCPEFGENNLAFQSDRDNQPITVFDRPKVPPKPKMHVVFKDLSNERLGAGSPIQFYENVRRNYIGQKRMDSYVTPYIPQQDYTARDFQPRPSHSIADNENSRYSNSKYYPQPSTDYKSIEVTANSPIPRIVLAPPVPKRERRDILRPYSYMDL